MQTRNRRSGVEDLWHISGQPATGANRSKRYGRGKRWRARWVDPEGREKSKAFDRKVDATKYLERVSAQMVRGDYIDPATGRETVGAVAARFMAGFTGKPKTRAGYESLLRSRILPRWGSVPVDAVRESQVRAWLAAMLAEGVSASRTRQAGTLLRQVLDLAVADRMLVVNPATRVKLPRGVANREATFLNAGQLFALAGEAGRDRDFILLLGLTGLRWGEAVALRGEAVDLDRRRLTISRTFGEISGKVVAGTPKSHATRWVPFPSILVQPLRERVEGHPPQDLLFTSPQGDVLRSGNFAKRVLRPAAARAGVADLRIHDLRHTAASLAISAGANVKALQRMLGHESASLTLDTYGSLFEDDLSSVSSALDSLLADIRVE